MYIRKQAPKRYCTPVRGRKQKTRKIKQIILILLMLAVIAGAFFALKKASSFLFSVKKPAWLEWRLKKVRITGATSNTAYEVSKYLSLNEGDRMTFRDANNLEKWLKSNIKQLEKVSVSRGLISKDLSIKIKKRPALARVKVENKTLYLGASGLLFGDEDLKKNTDITEVSVSGKIKGDILPKELVKLIKELSAEKTLKLKDIKIDLDKESFSLQIQDTAAVDMGGFYNAEAKLEKLADILQVSRDRILKKPYSVNFSYFEDGKIYLKPTL